MAIDPGGHTGVAWGLFDDRARLVEVAMREGSFKESATIEGDEYEQMELLYQLWTDFKAECVNVRCLDPDKVELVAEDFILKPGYHKPGKEGISPARILWAFEGYRRGRAAKFRRDKHISPLILQTPGDAARYNKRTILTSWDCWIRGKEHERAAFAHIGLRMHKILR
jgi:hypothetical protein